MLRLIVNPNRTEPPDQPNAAMDEHIWLGRIAQGDQAAFEQLYKNYYPRLFRFILRMTRQPELVEELIQETLMVVWLKPGEFNRQSKLSTWIFGIAYHKALKALAKHARRGQDIDVTELCDSLGDSSGNPAQKRENEDWLNRALAILPAEQRAVIELTFYHDMAYQEIAKILDCPENTVKTRMYHARKKLQDFAETRPSKQP
ncbi:MAG: sigma-70 family RNA polymerase sigma factor [Methylomonas sp.]|jgi:RNA polymerase sigma-70 factor (ECF subfamily)